MYTIGVFNHLVHIVGKGVLLFVQGIHLKRTTTLRGYTIVIPPRELRNQNLCIWFATTFLAIDRQEIVDSILQHILAAIGQQYLLFRYIVDFAQLDADNALLALVIDTGVEA